MWFFLSKKGVLMKKINIIKKEKEINEVIKTGKKYKNKYFIIYIKDNGLDRHRFCVCVSKKLGNAVTRNKNKRQVKDIIDKSKIVFSNNKDYVIILNREINLIDFEEKKINLIDLLKQLEGEYNEE